MRELLTKHLVLCCYPGHYRGTLTSTLDSFTTSSAFSFGSRAKFRKARDFVIFIYIEAEFA